MENRLSKCRSLIKMVDIGDNVPDKTIYDDIF